jgi:hypothetical protein|tara:strand:+ start:447 stop:746 length:300 start_codon:yes stop_codon:yes gene_type:complete
MPDKISKEALDKGLITKKQYNNLNDTLLTAISKKKLAEHNKSNKPKKLTKRQENKLKEHSEHHSKKHINMMKKEMLEGKTFTQAHNNAKKLEKKNKYGK